MILPIPVRQPSTDESLRFVDLKGYEDFFGDLADGFPYVAPSFNIGCSATYDVASASALEVVEVGNYIASFVPTIADFSRLDERFTLPTNTWSKIPQYANYGFAVFQLAAGSLTPHPMALEFENAGDAIYFPTMHIHDGEIHGNEEFDHILYLQHAGFDSQAYGYDNSDVADKSTGLIRSKYVASHFCDVERANGVVHPDLLVHRKFVRGINPNRDTEIRTAGDPIRPTLNLRPLYGYAPWLVIGAAATWFFARRTKIKRIETAKRSDRDRTMP